MRTLFALLVVSLLALTGCTEDLERDTQTTEQASTVAPTEQAPPVEEAPVADEALVVSEPEVEPQTMRLVEVTRASQTIETGMVGIRIRPHEEGGFHINEAIEGMPAVAAGLEAGDRVVAVDGMSTDGMSLRTFVDLVRGEPGTPVGLSVIDADGVERTVEIARETTTFTQTACDRYREIRSQEEFGGIGTVLRGSEDGIVIGEVMEGTPAAEAELQPGERIAAIDGLSTEGARMFDYVSALRGEPGSTVTLDIVDAEGQTRSVDVSRASMVVPSGGSCGQ